MKGTTHALIGAGAALYVAQRTEVELPIMGAMLLLGALGGLLPDIDHPNSFISRRFPLPLWWFLRHRGITHSMFAVLLTIPLSRIHWAVSAVALGYVLHIAADALTLAGVRLWAPLTHEPVHFLPRPIRLRTGGISEGLIAATSVILIAYMLLMIWRPT